MASLYDPSNLYIFHIISTPKSPLDAFLFLFSIIIIYQILSSLGPNPIREKSWPFLFLLIPLLVFFGRPLQIFSPITYSKEVASSYEGCVEDPLSTLPVVQGDSEGRHLEEERKKETGGGNKSKG
ncbi:hypothetical protein M430DRAFT_275001 [Amorphotheca resinae ATCC 22711]|uniref:Uncharacterized protein n=1 Tax=Amorphotheca resinae ATCC 22711 TaxID=857342 RepID=A0A2T3B320_AMORE|nr:hypothetical protein M430DRAFT_275001 [Amorphotheca resinae ATCC 22711]PSS20036.1 hypothetical protein M430DRAFT_275001 [Amorphotheca resinae ATCC 22711]